MLFSIGEFSDLSGLPPQTLRYYHSEGLLVPEAVDEQTGYRSYAFPQVEQALLVATLRQAGLAVRDVRRALDDRDVARSLLQEQIEALEVQRRREDLAVEDARSLLGSWPEVRPRRFPGQVVLSAPVPHGAAELRSGPVADERWYDWDHAGRSFADTVHHLHDVAATLQLDQAGPAWKTGAVETPQQKIENLTAAGPHWLAKLPVVVADTAALAEVLPRPVEVQSWPSRDELVIRIPGRLTTAKYATALHRLVTHPLESAFVDLGPGGERVVVHDDGFELFHALCPLDG